MTKLFVNVQFQITICNLYELTTAFNELCISQITGIEKTVKYYFFTKFDNNFMSSRKKSVQ